MSREAIILFGGSFDPIHTGHLAIAQLALDTIMGYNSSSDSSHFSQGKVLFIPAAQNPLKKIQSSEATHRLAMVKTALQDSTHFDLWDTEIFTQGHSYSYDTITSIHKEFPKATLFFLIGSDNVESFHKWYKASEILSVVTLLVVKRPQSKLVFDPSLGEVNYREVASPFWGISSSSLRNYLFRGLSCNYLLPSSVTHYIQQNNLYKG